MIQKKKTPYGAYFFLFVFLEVVAYILSGLFKIPGVSFETLEENITYVFLHPFSNWNDKTIACLGIGLIVWFMVVSYIMYYHRNFYSDIEHGSARWLDAKEACKELKDEDPGYNRILSQNLQVSLREGLSNNNMLVVGSSGSFKTTSVMHQSLLQTKGCKVVLDVKGDTQRKLGKKLEKLGFTIKSLNFKNPEKSDQYDPFVYIEREDDLLRVINALFEAARGNKPASMADPFWDDGVKLDLQSGFYYEWLDAREHGRAASLNNVIRLTNLENKKIVDPVTGEEISELQKLMDEKAKKYGDDYPPVRDYRKLKEGAPDTVRSIVIMVNAMLRICETGEVKRIFSGNDIDIRELGTGVDGDPNKPVVLFLVIPDNNNAYNWIVSMFYTQMFDILIRLSDDELKAPLPIPVEVHLDEFYAGAKPADPDVLLGVIRSRNISMIPYLQSVSQIKSLFKDDKWETIMDNVATVVYLGSGPMASSTHKFISEALDKATIDSRSDNVHMGSNANSGLNFNKAGRELMKPNEVKEMSRTDCIIFLESHPPIYDTKAIPFDVKSQGYKAPKWLKKRYKEALSLGNYEHPVYTLYDPEHFSYITINREKPMQIITNREEIRTYQEAAKHDSNIYAYNVEEKDLLYLSWGHEKRSQEEVEALLKQAMEAEQKRMRDIRGLVVLQDLEGQEVNVPNFGTTKLTDKSKWNKNAPLNRLLMEHWDEMAPEEQEEICLAIDDGLTEEQLRKLMLQPLHMMALWRRAYAMENNAR